MASNLKTKKKTRKKASPETIQPVKPIEPAPVEQTDDFSKVVQESKNRLHAEANKPLKRGRGRPRDVKPTENSSSPNVSNSGSTTAPIGGPVQQMNIAPMIQEPLILLSSLPAKKYKCDELVLTDEEAAACAKAVNDLLNAFIPDLTQMSPKTAAVFGAVITFGAVGMNKVIILSNHRAKYKDEIKAQEAEINKTAKSDPAVEQTINAQDAFRPSMRQNFPATTV